MYQTSTNLKNEIDKKINSDPEFAAFVEEQSLLHFAIVESYRNELSQDIGQLMTICY